MTEPLPTPTPTPWASESIDPLLADTESILEYETELMWGRRSFWTAQTWFAQFAGVQAVHQNVSINWHGTTTDLNAGSFAVVRSGSSLQSLVGDILKVWIGSRSVFVYCCADSDIILTDISLYQRAFMAIGLLATPPAGRLGKVEVCS